MQVKNLAMWRFKFSALVFSHHILSRVSSKFQGHFATVTRLRKGGGSYSDSELALHWHFLQMWLIKLPPLTQMVFSVSSVITSLWFYWNTAWIFGSTDFSVMQPCCPQVSGWNSNRLCVPLSWPFDPQTPAGSLSQSSHCTWYMGTLDFLPHQLGNIKTCKKGRKSNNFLFIDLFA